MLRKYVCEGTSEASSLVACPDGYDCESGRCIMNSSACSDTDGGENIYVAGTVTVHTGLVSAEYLDKCMDSSTVEEYYCSGDGYATEIVKCPAGYECDGGACREPACTDTDNGVNIFIKGVVNKGADSYPDYCTDAQNGIEYYCQDNQVENEEFTCPAGYSCTDGKCGR